MTNSSTNTSPHPLAHHLSKRFNLRQNLFDFESKPYDNIEKHPNPIFLHFGVPNDGFFPLEKMDLITVDSPFETYRSANPNLTTLSIPRHEDSKNSASGLDLATYLQYQYSYGTEQFEEFVVQFIKDTHEPAKKDDWDAVCSLGTGDAVYKVFDLLLDAGDTMLIEEFTFVPTCSSAVSFGAELVPITLDFEKDGIDLIYFENLLNKWSDIYPDKKFPKCLYTIASGHNPMGKTQTLESRLKIYELCDKFDIIIIEDDPYGAICLSNYYEGDPEKVFSALSIENFKKNFIPTSYVEIDKSGRVIRLDSFSKTIIPGLRLGIITANKCFISNLKIFIDLSTKFPSGFSQLVLLKIFRDKFHGIDGYYQWLMKFSIEYSKRKQVMMKTLMSDPLFDKLHKFRILEPDHGMFTTVVINFKDKSKYVEYMDILEMLGLKHGIIFVLGTRLAITKETKDDGNFVRLALSPTQTLEELQDGIERFLNTLREFFSKYDK